MSDHHKSEKQKKAAAMGAVARKKGDSANNKSQATRNITSDKQPSKLKLKDFNEALKEAGTKKFGKQIEKKRNNDIAPKRFCKYFNSDRGCTKGDSCEFAHTKNFIIKSDYGKDNKNLTTAKVQQNKSKFSVEVENFLQDIPQKLKSTFLITSENNAIWHQGFEAVANCDRGDTRFTKSLLDLYLKTIDNEVSTPRVDFVLKILSVFLKSTGNPDAFRLVHRVIEKRLMGEASCKCIQDRETILDLVEGLDSVRSAEYKKMVNSQLREDEYHDCANELKKIINMYKQRVQSLVLQPRLGTETIPVQPSFGWVSSPSLSWLLDKRWLNVKDFQESYQSLDDYIDNMQQMWTMLTFYWGAAAFWPRCNTRNHMSGGDKESCCGNPMMHYRAGKDVTCSRISCHRPASWGFHRRDHDRVCDGCLLACQEKLLGPPGKDASTDVYDACIDIIGENKTIHCSQLLSRRPPKVDINWQTSYRLQPANMVAVIPLAMKDIGLKRSDKLLWGEVVVWNHKDGNQKEYGRRKRGNISIRLLGKNDCNLFNDSTEDDLGDGQKIAIVDLKVFVPEVISVLATLSSNSFKESLRRVSFQKSLLDSSTAQMLPIVKLTLREMINHALHHTSISAVANLNENHKQELVEQIWSIPQVQSLDETQGIAFASALLQSLHTVQGPPGSGKSYVGVCLLLALSKIRQFVNRGKQQDALLGPIIVLSYKNHALDEFLLDALGADPVLRGKGNLVRLGKPDNQELGIFTERNTDLEKVAKQKLLKRLETIRSCKQRLLNIRCSPILTHERAAKDVISGLAICIETLVVLDSTDVGESHQNVMQFETETGKLKLSTKIFNLLKELSRKEDFFDWENILESLHTNGFIATETLDLIVSVEHWGHRGAGNLRSFARFEHLYGKFIRGDVPPLRCSAFMQGANNYPIQCLNCVSNNFGQYCDTLHRCRHISNCQGLALPDGQCCELHCCLDESCCRSRLPNSDYCCFHACPHCLCVKPLDAGGCGLHQCSVRGCSNVAIGECDFCTQHCCHFCLTQGKVTNDSKVPRGSQVETCSFHRCNIRGCGAPRINHRHWCSHHSCIYCDEASLPGIQVCLQHKCADDQCTLAVVVSSSGTPSTFCSAHSCYICAALKAPNLNYAIDRNACELHQLCEDIMSDGQLCCALRSNNADSIYCADHLENNFTCHGIAKTKKRCKSLPLPGTLYCNAHKNQQNQCRMSNSSQANNNQQFQHQWNKIDVFYPLPFINREPVADSAWNIKPDGCVVFRCTNQFCNCTTSFQPFQVEDILSNGGWYCRVHCPADWYEPIVENSEVTIGIAVDKVDPTEQTLQSQQELQNAKSSELIGDFCFHYNEAFTNAGLNVDELEFFEDSEEGDGDKDNANNLHNREIFEEDVDLELMDHQMMLEDGLINQEKVDPTLDWSHVNEKTLTTEILRKEIKDFVSINWTMPTEQRHRHLQSFASFSAKVFKILIRMAEPFVDDARREKDDANGLALKQASVIGGTVVGAAKRLPALRAAEPFAVIVEEACEVMEPTLIAVLAVQSLQKLELIGDHRQLPAYVNQCWYDISIAKPNLKKSLFERIVLGVVGQECESQGKSSSAYANHPICTILDIQRRMRSSISELTKHEYADIVTIKDHAITRTQCIGDRLKKDKLFKNDVDQVNRLKTFRQDVWREHGRHVPGIATNIFFWDLEGNVQSAPKAGLSACNENEADAVVKLVKYLHACGVPLPAITVITPYQGQKRVLVDYLRKSGCLPKRNNNANNGKMEDKKTWGKKVVDKAIDEGLTLTVSTVDRFQGDENDIVILSMVRVKPGNAFVSLANRFIVAASRARLGFYIVGSQNAVCTKGQNGELHGPGHWKRFITHLNTVPPSLIPMVEKVDEDLPTPLEEEISSIGQEPVLPSSPMQQPMNLPTLKTPFWRDNDGFLQPRIGGEFPICCPLHNNFSTRFIRSGKDQRHFPDVDTWGEFCKVPCDRKLACGHDCGLPCHIGKGHQPFCPVQLVRPCEEHKDIPVVCGNLVMKGCCNWQDALNTDWQCMIGCSHILPCGHEIEIPCRQLKAMIAREKPWPRCEIVVKRFDLPCGHTIKNPKCFEEQDFLKNGIFPLCKVEMEIMKSCGLHKMKTVCFKSKQQLIDCQNALCEQTVRTHRPRCGHNLTLKCHDSSELLKLWNRRGYGSCVPCKEPVIDESLVYGPSEESIYGVCKSLKPCEAKVTIRRNCGHSINVNKCHAAFSMLASKRLDPCTEVAEGPCPLCHRKLSLPCHLKLAFDQYDLDEVFDGRSYEEDHGSNAPLDQRVILDESFLHQERLIVNIFDAKFEGMWNYLLQKKTACGNHIKLRRRCGHMLEIDCSKLVTMGFLPHQDPLSMVPPCLEKVMRTLTCGHMIEVPCESMKKVEPKCKQAVKEHFVFPDCQHQLVAKNCFDLQRMKNQFQDNILTCKHPSYLELPPCFHRVSIACSRKSTVMAQFGDADRGEPLIEIESGVQYCLPCELDDQVMCSVPMKYRRSCGHTDTGVPCSAAILRALGRIPEPQQCGELVDAEHPICHHIVSIPCWRDRSVETSDTWECNKLIEVECSSNCHVQSHPCSQALNWSQEDIDRHCLIEVIKKCTKCCINQIRVPCKEQVIHCRTRVTARLDCGHDVTWNCDEDIHPKHSYDADRKIFINCPSCVLKLWEGEKALNISLESLQARCLEMLSERLEEPDINKVLLKAPIPIDLQSLNPYEHGRVDLINRIQEAINKRKRGCAILPPIRKLGEGFIDVADRNRELDEHPGDEEMVEAEAFPVLREYIEKNYELVYLPCQIGQDPDPKQIQNRRFGRSITHFGQGLKLQKFTRKAILPLAATGEIKLCLALAFRANPLDRTSRDGDNSVFLPLAKFDDSASCRAANLEVMKYRGLGHDCCLYEEDVDQDLETFVFWEQRAVIPLYIVHLQLHETCGICGDHFPNDKKFGCICPMRHFICTESCLPRYIDAAANAESNFGYLSSDGKLICYDESCKKNQITYDCRHCSIDIFDKINALRIKVCTDQAVRAALEEERRKVAEEQERLRQMDEETREIHLLKTEITGNILIPKCPRCKQAFIDFEGCFALTCCNKRCNAAFCAWCEADCGSDAHTHVAHCRFGNGEVFGNLERLNQVRNTLRKAKIENLLRVVSASVKAKVLEDLRKDFADIGLQM